MPKDKKSGLHVVFIAGGVNVPATRFRVQPLEAEAIKRGLVVRHIYGFGTLDTKLHSNKVRRIYRIICRLLRALRTAMVTRADVVFVQRLSIPISSLPERILILRGVPVIFDFDDAVDLRSNGEPSRMRRRALEKMFKESALIIAGNSWLASKAKKAKASVEVVPTSIHTKQYRPAAESRPESAVPKIGWMGTSSNYVNLGQMKPIFNSLREDGYDFSLEIVSDSRDQALLDELGADFRFWSPEKEISLLHGFDIGIMPLADTEWAKGKCGFKLIQYMAVGLPVVASDVGFNRDVVVHGKTGFLARNETDWIDSLRKLLTGYELRVQFGALGRHRAVERFSTEIWASHVVALIESVAGAGRK